MLAGVGGVQAATAAAATDQGTRQPAASTLSARARCSEAEQVASRVQAAASFHVIHNKQAPQQAALKTVALC